MKSVLIFFLIGIVLLKTWAKDVGKKISGDVVGFECLTNGFLEIILVLLLIGLKTSYICAYCIDKSSSHPILIFYHQTKAALISIVIRTL